MPAVVPDLHAFDLGRIAAGSPYRPFPAAGDPLWAGRDRRSVAALLAEARIAAAAPTPPLTREHWLRFFRAGERPPYERPYFERRRRLALFAMAQALRPDPRTRRMLIATISAILDEVTWCVPAHNQRPGGELQEDPDPAAPVVDLFAAETAGELAWTLSLHESELGALAGRISAEIDGRVLRPFEHDARASFWFRGATNWNPWIVSNVITSALLIGPPPPRVAEILRIAVDSLDGYVHGVPADGGCPEGIMYWWQSGARLFEAIETLGWGDGEASAEALGSDLLARTADYPLVVGLGDGVWSAAFADGRSRVQGSSGGSMNQRNSPELLFRMAAAVGDSEIADYARVMRGTHPAVMPPLPLSRALPALFDTDWCSLPPAPPAEARTLPAPRWLEDTQVFSAGVHGLRLVAKGGHNDEPHNHLDVGGFVVARDGEPLIIDVGSGLYTADSFTEHRYEQWFTRSEFHSVPYGAQGIGPQYRATDATAHTGDDWSFSLDLAAAYPGSFGSWRRSFAPSGDGIQVRDAWAGAETEPAVVFMLARPPVPRADGWGLVGPDSARVRAVLETEAVVRCETVVLDDPVLVAMWGETIARLVVRSAGAGRTGQLTSRFCPV